MYAPYGLGVKLLAPKVFIFYVVKLTSKKVLSVFYSPAIIGKDSEHYVVWGLFSFIIQEMLLLLEDPTILSVQDSTSQKMKIFLRQSVLTGWEYTLLVWGINPQMETV